MKTKTNKKSASNTITKLFARVTLNDLQKHEVKQTADDFKHSVLLVSLLVNAFFITGWLVVEVTNRYNDQLIAYLLQ